MCAALAGYDHTVEHLIDDGVHCYVRDCGGMNLLDVAIDLAEVDVVKSICEHAYVQVYERDVRRAQRVHVFWADKSMAVARDVRAAAHETDKLDDCTKVLKMVMKSCWANIPRERHVKACFADGKMYSDLLLEEETAEIDRKEQEHAARSIQFAVKRRNKERGKKKKSKSKSRKSSTT